MNKVSEGIHRPTECFSLPLSCRPQAGPGNTSQREKKREREPTPPKTNGYHQEYVSRIVCLWLFMYVWYSAGWCRQKTKKLENWVWNEYCLQSILTRLTSSSFNLRAKTGLVAPAISIPPRKSGAPNTWWNCDKTCTGGSLPGNWNLFFHCWWVSDSDKFLGARYSEIAVNVWCKQCGFPN